MSQIGTRVTCLLDDERDIQAVLAGIPNGGGLRSVLARLDSKQQAILLGHAVPMPVVVKTRDYDEKFYGDVAMGRVRSNGHVDQTNGANGEPKDAKAQLKDFEDFFAR